MALTASQPESSDRLSREILEFDVVIVGAGPSGLSAACRLAQLATANDLELSIAVVEKSAEIGGHIVSGAVIETHALDELFPDWRDRDVPTGPAVSSESLVWLRNEADALAVPGWLVPRPLRNIGNRIVSLGNLCRWLAGEAEGLGCDVLTGFAATELVIDAQGRIAGVSTGARGVKADGTQGPDADPGYELRSRFLLLAEGCRGSLGGQVERLFGLREQTDPQHYGIGFKEVWQTSSASYRPGFAMHTLGWPLDKRTEGGGFIYHADGGRLYVGFVVALNYVNPYLNPFEEFQRFKRHPHVRALLDGANRIGFGARAVNKGGLHSLPRLSFPGGALIGCDAGFLNGAKLKGTHTAIKSGMLAAEAILDAIRNGSEGDLDSYEPAVRRSWIYEELRASRNFSAGMSRFGIWGGGALAFLEHNVFRGRAPWNLRNRKPDYAGLAGRERATPIRYDRPDGIVSFDRLSSIHLSNISHEEDQPCHLRLADPTVPIARNLPGFDEPATRYCPARVYELVDAPDGSKAFRINAANCIHCKTCEIKDPSQNITWVPPEGGSGPNYSGL